ncbi:MAG TPA: penicillin-binding protein 2 [Candidatus Acidoferrales bacterium]|nr:penicillin-binding protein 2 [Candidatus Acidoferrales bacterium]
MARRHAGFTRTLHTRVKALFYVFFFLAGFLLYRLYEIQVVQGAALSEKAEIEHSATIDVLAQRGTIYDRDGNAIVRSLPSQSIYATTAQVTDPAGEAQRLAPILGISAERLEPALADTLPTRLLARKVSQETAEQVRQLALAGVDVVPEETGVRYVPSGRFASTILGFTGIDDNGLDGIEYAYDDVLRGINGKMILEEDEFGHRIPFAPPHIVQAAQPGRGIVLTIDSYLQFEAERVLRQTVQQWHAASGTILIMDPSTGEILAVANAPDYDLREFWRYSPDARRDRAVMDAYEPGSTFKLITAAAALESGKVQLTSRFPARDELTIGGHTIHNAEDGFIASRGDTESLEDIIAYSHNVGAAEVALRIGGGTLYKMVRAFGFGDETGVGLPGENPGIVLPPDQWSATTLPTMAFGHSISVTPLALARAYCAIANGGLLLKPQIVRAIVDQSGNQLYQYRPEVERRVISERVAAQLRGFLRAVVVRGTGNPTAQVPGYTTAGKTGTAQVVENGAYSPGDYIASFVGMIPAQAPRYVILVKIDEPRGAIYGSEVAAPAFAVLARAAMLHAGVMPLASPAPLAHPATGTGCARSSCLRLVRSTETSKRST